MPQTLPQTPVTTPDPDPGVAGVPGRPDHARPRVLGSGPVSLRIPGAGVVNGIAPFELDPGRFELHDVVLREVLRVGKAPDLTLQGCVAWLSAQSVSVAAIWEASTL